MHTIAELRRRFGISTLALRQMPLDEAIQAVTREGFGVFELTPRLYGGPERFDRQMRQRLRESLGPFEMVTVHSSGSTLPDGRKANIASSDESYRRESVAHYLALVELALDLGAGVVTFHLGRGDEKTSPDRVRDANRIFAGAATEKATGSDLQMGYECFDTELIKDIGEPRFGILFDIGHAIHGLEADVTPGIVRMIKECFPSIVQFHVHGVQAMAEGVTRDHLPLQLNDVIDYADVIREIGKGGFAGPLVLEIGIRPDGQDAARNLKDAVYARDEFVAVWRDCFRGS